jgi:hypothetical protein
LHSARKELAILATFISLEGNLYLIKLIICLVTTSSLSLVKLLKLGIILLYKGCLAR